MADSLDKIVQEIADDLFPAFEALETQSAAILQFLKAKGMATDEELAPYLEQAANGSSVRWRAVRIRLEHLISSAVKIAEDSSAGSNQKQAAEPQKVEGLPQEGSEKQETQAPKPENKAASQTQPDCRKEERATPAKAKDNSTTSQSAADNPDDRQAAATENLGRESKQSREDAA
ncbi:MAG TPA: hypothetical protein VMB18_18635 [Terriglobales bacterium]|nr:hypothetical protein [Terriglobales bacterium]